MTEVLFQPGDRVRARVSTPFVQAGMLGTVVPGYATVRNANAVHFDGQSASILMWSDELERADRPADETPSPKRSAEARTEL
jgi:hypothetical protein